MPSPGRIDEATRPHRLRLNSKPTPDFGRKHETGKQETRGLGHSASNERFGTGYTHPSRLSLPRRPSSLLPLEVLNYFILLAVSPIQERPGEEETQPKETSPSPPTGSLMTYMTRARSLVCLYSNGGRAEMGAGSRGPRTRVEPGWSQHVVTLQVVALQLIMRALFTPLAPRSLVCRPSGRRTSTTQGWVFGPFLGGFFERFSLADVHLGNESDGSGRFP